jgi:hypothetical protein
MRVVPEGRTRISLRSSGLRFCRPQQAGDASHGDEVDALHGLRPITLVRAVRARHSSVSAKNKNFQLHRRRS